MIVVRLILRFLLVPLGAAVALCAAALFIILVHWGRFLALAAADTLEPEFFVLALLLMAPALVLMMSALLLLAPAAVGVLIAEAFAIRSWMFHVLNGALSVWLGWFAMEDIRKLHDLFDQQLVMVGTGIVAGFAYWAVAGWSAGFWKPVFKEKSPPGEERRSSRADT